jgi:hypothetical protein
MVPRHPCAAIVRTTASFGHPDDIIDSAFHRLAPNVRGYLDEHEVFEDDDGDKAFRCGRAVPYHALLSTDGQTEARVAIRPVF